MLSSGEDKIEIPLPRGQQDISLPAGQVDQANRRPMPV